MSVVEVASKLDANPHNTGIATYTGRTFDVKRPGTWDFDIEDIARGLSSICRFGGQVDFYSVAEHSIRVSELLMERKWSPSVQLLGLLHDAAEAYIGDIPRPWKGEVMIGDMTYHEVEAIIEANIFTQFGLWHDYVGEGWKAVKAADVDIYMVEAASRPTPSIMSADPRSMYRMFMWKFQTLSDAVRAESVEVGG